jgi:hypothetical protein
MTLQRTAFAYSLFLHGGLIVLAIVGLPVLFRPELAETPILEAELAKLADITTPKPEPVPEPPKPEPPKPQVIEPPKPPPEPKPEEVVEPVPAPKPKPKPEPPKPEFDPQRIAALLDKRLRDKQPPPEPRPAPATPSATASTLETPLSMSEVDLIRSQLERCWNPPIGAPDPGSLVVRIRVLFNPDGSLRAPPTLLDSQRMSDGFWRAAAESALRAVHKCQPLRDLPAAKYDRWRDIELTFDPKNMVS